MKFQGFIEPVSILLHLVINLRIRFYKAKMKRESNPSTAASVDKGSIAGCVVILNPLNVLV